MQQQQLAAQLAHHGGSRQPPLSPAPHSSDSDSDISLGAHSPPITSPGPRFGAHSPTPISTFRFGPHSPGPMPPQFRFGNNSPPNFSHRRSPMNSSPGSFLRRSENSPINVDTPTSNYRLDRNSPNTNTNLDNSPIDVETTSVYKNSPIRVDSSPPLHHSPPMNLRVSERHSETMNPIRIHPENPIPIRLGSSAQLTAPLRIRVNSPSRLMCPSSPQTNLQIGAPPHGGIVRIVPPSPPPPQTLHRPFSPPRLT